MPEGTRGCKTVIRGHKVKQQNYVLRGGIFMKGYSTESGYMGLVEGRYMLFASEEDYRDYMED